jgi:hypothetical protein
MENKLQNNIINSVKSAQSNIIYYTNDDIKNDNHCIIGTMKLSYILDNTNDKKIIYKNKINHLMLTKCKNIDVTLDEIVSGIDMIECKNCNINIDSINTIINIENSSNIRVCGQLTNDSMLLLLKNMEIYHNNKLLRSTPFNDIIYSIYGCFEINRTNLLDNYQTLVI